MDFFAQTSFSQNNLITIPNIMSRDYHTEKQLYHVGFRWTVPDDLKSNDEILHKWVIEHLDKYIYQFEDIVTNGRHNYHYQGYGHLRSQLRAKQIKTLAMESNGSVSGIEVQPACTEGITNLQAYSMKVKSRVRGPWADKQIYLGADLISNLYPWQQSIKDEVETHPDNRSISVVYNPEGNIGKSAFCKYMSFHHKTLSVGWAKTGDLLNLVSKNQNRTAYFFDLSRTRPKDWASDDIYAAMEGIKNGHFINTKYETCEVLMKIPHVWIFTNTLPRLSAMSRDRWRIFEIRNTQLVRCAPSRIRQLSVAPARDASPDRIIVE